MKNFRMLLWVFTASLTANPTPAQNWVWVSGTADMYPSVIASSADGSKLAVAVYYLGTNGIYTSTNSGATWLPSSAPNWNWSSIASSADGSRLVAAGYGGVYTSTNFGVTWFSNNVPSWSAVASSADGSRLVAVGRQICISTNSGNVWAVTSAPTTNWCSVASSANGNLLLAGTFGG